MTPDTRCLGLLPSLDGGTQRCEKRAACTRYTQRHTGGVIAEWLCPTLDDYFGAYIESEPHASAVTT